MDKENIFMLMKVFMMVNGNMAWRMVWGSINTKMGAFIRDFGKMIKNVEKEFINNMIEVNMMESGWIISRMDLENKHMLMEVHMKGIG